MSFFAERAYFLFFLYKGERMDEKMNYQEAISYIEAPTPRKRYGFQGLRKALEMMGNPHLKTQYIHIAGTNGKGSCAAMLSSVMTKSGYRTGMFISPHLIRYNERISVNGQDISDEDFVRAAEKVKEVCDTIGETPIVFEVLTLMAFWYFGQQNCDIVVLEVGIGGRIDATNIIPVPKAAVIAQLGMDHTEILGDTIEKIAAEKGGIIKENGHVIMAKQTPEAIDTIRHICEEKHAHLTIADPERFTVLSSTPDGQKLLDKEYGELFVPLAGPHQVRNTANVIEAIGQLKEQGYKIPDQAVRDGIAQTHWNARFQKLHSSPDIILDGGHNPQCVQAATQALKTFYPGKKIIFLTGMMADKDTPHMLCQMAQIAKAFVCISPDSPRAMKPEELRDTLIHEYHAKAVACDNAQKGVQTALEMADKDDVICVLGSLYLAGEMDKALPKA